MTRLRLLAKVAVGLILFAFLVGLIWIVIDEKCSKRVSENEAAKSYQQSVPYGGNK